MNSEFVFDADVEDENAPVVEAPWEFEGYSAAVENDYRERKTTSVDHKISELRQRRVQRVGVRGSSKLEVGSSPGESDVEDDTRHLRKDSTVIVREKNDRKIGKGRTKRTVVKRQNSEDESDVENDRAVTTRNEPDGVRTDSKKSGNFFSSADGATFTANSFGELNISRPLIRACESLGYKQPTPIQAACIPLALTGRDICGSAITGSGKTAAFGLPLLERLLFRPRRVPATRVLILTPTRELAVQVHSMLQKLAQFTDIRCCLVVGGLSSKVQETALRSHPDIVVATPGRMIDHLHNSHSVGLEELAILVLDEADRLLELGFSQEVQELVRLCPKRRQTMLFSATMTEKVAELVQLSLNSPVRLSADPSTQRPSTLSEEVVKFRPATEADKESVLLALCTRSFKSKVIIFSGTKVVAHRLKILFGLFGLKAAELHGNLTQAMRLDALETFRKQEADFLIATDVAARGLDIIGVETVINFECPNSITTYVHRVGRTARAGRQGCALTFVTERDRVLLKAMSKRAGQKLQSRVIPHPIIIKWHLRIEEMEDDIKTIHQQEREEMIMRKAEMEVNKAQNMMDHEAEIYSRPKRIWFQSTKEKKVAAKAAVVEDEHKVGNKVVSVLEAGEQKKKAKRQLEREKNMSRKKRRRLEASQEEEDDGEDQHESTENGGKTGSQSGRSIVDIAYRKAKAAKSAERLREAGKLPRKIGNEKKKVPKNTKQKKRKEEMEKLFRGDMSVSRSKKSVSGGGIRTKKRMESRKSFKSKSRYKRRK